MLNELCGSLNNWFVRGQDGDIKSGKYTIKDGMIEVPFLAEGQYFRIVGSVFNDGIYQYPAYDLIDEVFNGEIWCNLQATLKHGINSMLRKCKARSRLNRLAVTATQKQAVRMAAVRILFHGRMCFPHV